MSVYRKTMQGRLDAFNSQSTLPQGLRQLLLHVDGKTQFNRLQNYLGAQTCSDANMGELVKRGYVRAVGYSLDDEFDFDESSRANDMQHRPTMPSPLRFLMGDQPAVSRPLAFDEIAFPHTTRGVHPIKATYDAAKQAEESLNDAKDLMSDFVLTHIPQHAFSALKEIEQITSLAILASTVDAYELLVQPTGISGKRHIQKLKGILKSAA